MTAFDRVTAIVPVVELVAVPDADIVAFASVAATEPTTVEVPVAVLVAFANVTATLPVTIGLPDAVIVVAANVTAIVPVVVLVAVPDADIVALASVTDAVAVTTVLPDADIVAEANVVAIAPLEPAGAAGDLRRSNRLMSPPYRLRCACVILDSVSGQTDPPGVGGEYVVSPVFVPPAGPPTVMIDETGVTP
jgi:hypothetical protein